ncbi:hypothetical protein [Lunatimonas salinarum]|uniref:hypothetical protein n=1 Tax=Lunatimonas salinarum TaxID=1774590 RepID=UPI001AE02426|nr:hypothetical protein [Lunatimonas salinarum]
MLTSILERNNLLIRPLRIHGKYAEENLFKLNAGSYLTQSAKDRMVDGLSELAGSLQRSGSGNPIAILNLANILASDLQNKEAPEAYLIYALYDTDSNRYEVEDRALRNSPVDCFSEGPGCGLRFNQKRRQPTRSFARKPVHFGRRILGNLRGQRNPGGRMVR